MPYPLRTQHVIGPKVRSGCQWQYHIQTSCRKFNGIAGQERATPGESPGRSHRALGARWSRETPPPNRPPSPTAAPCRPGLVREPRTGLSHPNRLGLLRRPKARRPRTPLAVADLAQSDESVALKKTKCVPRCAGMAGGKKTRGEKGRVVLVGARGGSCERRPHLAGEVALGLEASERGHIGPT